MLPTTLTRDSLRELARAMRTACRRDRDLHRTGRAIFLVRFFFGGLPEPIDRANEQENGTGHDEKVNHQRDEVAVIPSDRSGFRGVSWRMECRRSIFGGSQNNKLV